MAEVNLRRVIKRYDEVEAVRGIDLDIADHEFVVLVGPSGCGKSTTLRMIAGLEDITDGDIMIGGDVVNDVPPKDRDIAMVFQNYALYPHMTVAENMSFGLRLKRFPKAEIKTRVDEAARMLDIVELVDRIAFPLPPKRAARYHGVARNEKLLLGLRPEHIAEAKAHPEPGVEAFDTVLDVTEPMGMETLVYFTLEGAQICGRVNPNAGARDGAPLRLAVDLNNIHLLNEVTGVVL